MAREEWGGIEEFVAVADSGSFSRAALKLGCSTSKVSREIALLETRIRTSLFFRTTRQVRLTDAGRLLLDPSRRLVEERDEALSMVMDRDRSPKGLLRFTCSVAYGERFVVPLIGQFLHQFPEISVSIELNNRMLDLVGEGFDLAIRTGAMPDSRLVATRIASRRVHLCASPEYLKRRGTPAAISDLGDHDCLVGSSDQWHFLVDGKLHLFRPKGRWHANSGFAVLEAALQHLGICHLPDFYVAEHLASGRLLSLLDAHRPPDEPIHAVYPHRRHILPKVTLLVDYLREQLREGS